MACDPLFSTVRALVAADTGALEERSGVPLSVELVGDGTEVSATEVQFGTGAIAIPGDGVVETHYVKIRGPEDSLALGNGAMTVEGYFFTTDLADSQILFSGIEVDGESSFGWCLRLETNGNLSLLANDDEPIFTTSGGAFTSGSWHLVQLSVTPEDGGETVIVRVYVDGVLSVGGNITGEAPFNMGGTFTEGDDEVSYVLVGRAYAAADRDFNGFVDQLRVSRFGRYSGGLLLSPLTPVVVEPFGIECSDCDPDFVNVRTLWQFDTGEPVCVTAGTGEHVVQVVDTAPFGGITYEAAKFGVTSYANVHTGVDGTNWLEFRDSDDLNRFSFDGPFTWEFWMRQRGGGAPLTLLANVGDLAESDVGYVQILYSTSWNGSTPTFAFTLRTDTGLFNVNTGAGFALDQTSFHYVAIVRDEDDMITLYIDSVQYGAAMGPVTGRVGPTDPPGGAYIAFGRGIPFVAADGGGLIDQFRMTEGARVVSTPTDPFGGECPLTTTVPAVVGELFADATDDIVAANLVVGVVTEVIDDSPAGTVLAQSPDAGTEVETGSAVDLTVSLGPEPPPVILIPNLIGLTMGEAQPVTDGLSFILTSTSAPNNIVPVGVIFSQSPFPGTESVFGATISVIVSLGPSLKIVPDVVGLGAADANVAIQTAGLRVGVISYTSDSTADVGDVLSQLLVAGTLVPAGTRLGYTVNTFIVPFDVHQTVISQYQNSATILAIVDNMAEYLDPRADLGAFYGFVWNVDTAQGFGLDIWGRIVGVSRLLRIPLDSPVFGFENTSIPADWLPWGQGSFASSSTGGSSLTFVDTFTRANADPLDGAWDDMPTAGTLQLLANEVLASLPATDSAMRSTLGPFPGTQSSTVTVGTVGGTDGGPMVLCQDGVFSGYLGVIDSGVGNAPRIFVIEAGSFTDLVSGAAVAPLDPGETLGLRVNSTTQDIELLRNGIVILTTNDDTFTEGSPGMFAFGVITFTSWTGTGGTPGGGSSQAYLLPDDTYRTLILTKALANIVATTSESFNQLLRNLFPGRGKAYVIDNGGMSMTFRFEFDLTPAEEAILTFSNAMPHPAGVSFNVISGPP